MPTLVERINTKIGPLPAWAWAAIPAGAYVVYSYYRASTVGPEPLEQEVPLDGGEYLNIGGTPSLPGYSTTPGGSSNLPAPSEREPFTNAQWEKNAANFLVNADFSSIDAARALQAYLRGFPPSITQVQMNALRKVLAELPPPEPWLGNIPSVIKAPSPTTPTPKPPAKPPAKVSRPSRVRNLAATPGLKDKYTQFSRITIRWSPPVTGQPVTSYSWRIHQGVRLIGSGTTRGLAVDTGNLKANTIHVFSVAATNAKGTGPLARTTRRTPK